MAAVLKTAARERSQVQILASALSQRLHDLSDLLITRIPRPALRSFVLPSFDVIKRIRPVLVDPEESDPFWACYVENIPLAQRLAASHPTLTVYTISCWGDENWIHRGLRTVNRLGYLFGTEDLGEDFAELLWRDDPASTE